MLCAATFLPLRSSMSRNRTIDRCDFEYRCRWKSDDVFTRTAWSGALQIWKVRVGKCASRFLGAVCAKCTVQKRTRRYKRRRRVVSRAMSVLRRLRWGRSSNKLAEHDTFAAAETNSCRFQIQVVADVMIERLESQMVSDAGRCCIQKTRMRSAQRDACGRRLIPARAGIAFPDHLTLETIEILSRCKEIYTNLSENQLGALPADLREKCVSLSELYRDGRTQNYEEVTEAVVGRMTSVRPLAWMTPGHPLIFDSVSQA